MSVQTKKPAVAAIANGFTELPPGKIAAVATYLEMREAPPARRPEAGAELFEPIGADVPRYRALYGEIGRDWLWFSRASLSDRDLRDIIGHSDVDALALVQGGRDIGLAELDFRDRGICELAFLGLVPEAVGQGWGKVLIAEAIRRAFARPIRRLWLHTCTLDHPSALGFYREAGFRPYLRAIEIADDPRLNGRLPADAAPGIPVI